MVHCVSLYPRPSLLESLAQLDRNLAPGAHDRAQEGMRRSLLRVVLYRYIQVLELVVPELSDHIPEKGHARMVLRQLFECLELARGDMVGAVGRRACTGTHSS